MSSVSSVTTTRVMGADVCSGTSSKSPDTEERPLAFHVPPTVNTPSRTVMGAQIFDACHSAVSPASGVSSSSNTSVPTLPDVAGWRQPRTREITEHRG